MSRRSFKTFFITPNAIAALLVGVLPTGLALGADPTALDRGHSLAVALCAVCHAVERDDASPTRINVETSFRDLYKRFPIDMITEAIKTGIIEGHDEMPAFQFASSELTDLLSYIDSLSPPGAPRYTR